MTYLTSTSKKSPASIFSLEAHISVHWHFMFATHGTVIIPIVLWIFNVFWHLKSWKIELDFKIQSQIGKNRGNENPKSEELKP
jgi:hypothetical protein